MNTPTLGVHNTDDTLIIQPAPNGGYIVSARSNDHHMGQITPIIGAFSDGDDLLTALMDRYREPDGDFGKLIPYIPS